MIKAVADTHTLLWFLQKDARLSAAALHVMNSAAQAGHQIAISSITLVEVAYLIEKNRIPQDSFDLIIQLLQAPNSMLVEIPLDHRVADSLRQVVRTQVPEMADRIIAATALMLGVPVISRDHKIQASAIATIW
ncbi:MAG: type II toxin-antitoxin system VapC family toxin [Blastocatellia bacterium]